MAITARKVAVGFLRLPGTIFGWLVRMTFGYSEENPLSKKSPADNKKPDEKKNPEEEVIKHHGLISLLLTGTLETGRAIANLVTKNRDTIATAFWMSLLLAGAAALTVFLWPAALTAITTFPVLGYTIAGVVGTNTLAQIGVIAGLAALATSVSTYTIAAIVSAATYLITSIIQGFKTLINACSRTNRDTEEEAHHEASNNATTPSDSPTALHALGQPAAGTSQRHDHEPFHSPSPLAASASAAASPVTEEDYATANRL